MVCKYPLGSQQNIKATQMPITVEKDLFLRCYQRSLIDVGVTQYMIAFHAATAENLPQSEFNRRCSNTRRVVDMDSKFKNQSL